MSRTAPTASRRLRSERGAVMTFVALLLPTFVLFMSFVIDVGNWFLHKRHLQLQADSAALASVGGYPSVLSGTCDNDAIKNIAKQFGGIDPAWTHYSDQKQIGGTPLAKVHQLINSKNYFNQSQPNDDTDTGQPCTNFQVDVKMTETDLPWFFKLANVNFINAQARVAILPVNVIKAAVPIGVSDVNPRSARIWFVNESGGVLSGCTAPGSDDPPNCTAPLAKGSTSGTPPVTGWSNAALPISTTIPSSPDHFGVRVAIGSGTSISATMATACASARVACYDVASSTAGLIYARDYSTSGSPNPPAAPIVRSVSLKGKDAGLAGASDCSGGSFSAGGCNIDVVATVDFGSATATSRSLTAAVAGGGTQTATMTGTDLTAGTKTVTITGISVPAGAGPHAVSLSWKEKGSFTITGHGGDCSKGQGCGDPFSPDPQRTFTADVARSGPIQTATLCTTLGCGANSFQQGTSQSLYVSIGITPSLQDAQSVSDPVHTLRFGAGSQNGAVDCGPKSASTFKGQLAAGCVERYTLNANGDCTGYGSSQSGWPAEPWKCVLTQTGISTNDVSAGLNQRVLGNDKPASCPGAGQLGHNNWSMFPDFPDGDPRIVVMFITPFGSFSGSGNQVFPVDDVAAFYITGWQGNGSGFDNPCQGNGDDAANSGEIKGHFIKYLGSFPDSEPGPGTCNAGSLAPCIPVMTR